MVQVSGPLVAAAAAPWLVLADATPVIPSAARPAAATAIPVMRPSACLMFMIAPCSPDTVSPGYRGLYEGRRVRSIGRMTYLPVTVFPNHVAKPLKRDGYLGTQTYMCDNDVR